MLCQSVTTHGAKAMTSIRLGPGLLAVAAIACGSGSQTSSVGASEITSYQDLADHVAIAATAYRSTMMDASTTLAMCADVHAGYDREVRPLVEQMVALGGDMDGFMDAHHGSGEADMECDATSLMQELDAHAVIACSLANLDDDRAEVVRHVGSMTGYTDHARQRCGEMMAGLDGQGWQWGGMMAGCGRGMMDAGVPPDGCHMMGCGGGMMDAGAPVDAGGDPLSLGKRIFDDGIGVDGQAVQRAGGMNGSYGCAMCHGSNGHGRTMTMFTAPNITYANLTDPLGMLAPDGTRGPTYTDASLQRAVVDGIDPDGDTLATWMPRWQLAGANWDDLLAYVKTLQ